jgi:hypothetical protein
MLEKLTGSLSEGIGQLLPLEFVLAKRIRWEPSTKYGYYSSLTFRGEARKLIDKVVEEIRQRKCPQILK